MSSSVREQVAEFLKPLVPAEWSLRPHTVKTIGTLSKTTLFIEHTSIESLPAAPVGHVQNTVVATVVSPLTDYAKAEAELDLDVLKLITALDGHEQLGFLRAEKRELVETYLGWAITLTATTQKE